MLAAHTVSVFGDRMVAVALAFAVLDAGGSTAAVGLVLACASAPLVLCLPAGGVVADRVSRRGLMVTADLVRVATQATLAALVITGTAQVWMLAALAGLTGAATGFFAPASTGLLPSVVPPEQLQAVNGLRGSLTAGGEIGGPLAAGAITAAVGPGWALGADAVTFLLSALLLAGVTVAPRAARQTTRFLADLREGWGAFRSRTWLWAVVSAAAFSNLLWGAWSALGPVVADRELGGAAAWGTVLAFLGAGALLGGLVAARSRPRRPLVWFALSGPVFSLPLAALALGTPVAPLAAAALLSGAAMMLGNAVWETTLQRHVPDESLSRVSSYDWFGSLAFYPVGVAMWGPIAALLGIASALWIAFALQGLVMLALLAVADVRRLPAAPSAA